MDDSKALIAKGSKAKDSEIVMSFTNIGNITWAPAASLGEIRGSPGC
jgi:hypothetical protein